MGKGAEKEARRSLQAAKSAARLLDELGIDTTCEIDVFSLCEDLGLWLAFMPLDGILGAFVPEGSGGVLVTDRRPVTVQRCVAAHALAHWRLDRGQRLALDDDDHLFGATPYERERLAQVFAVNLLLPEALMRSLLAKLGVVDGGSVGPTEANSVARQAGVSYEMAVRQMADLELIMAPIATWLLQLRPATVHRDGAGGKRSVDESADVWLVDEAFSNRVISVPAEGEVVVSLPENRSSGYRWMFEEEVTDLVVTAEPPPFGDQLVPIGETASLDRFLVLAETAGWGRGPSPATERGRRVDVEPDTSSLEHMLPDHVELLSDEYRPGRSGRPPGRDGRGAGPAAETRATDPTGAPAPRTTHDVDDFRGRLADVEPPIGGAGRRYLGFRFLGGGRKTVRLHYRSPYHHGAPAADFVLDVLIAPPRQGISIDQLVGFTEEPWVEQVRDRRFQAADV
jgi:hypothetical protein